MLLNLGLHIYYFIQNVKNIKRKEITIIIAHISMPYKKLLIFIAGLNY